MELQAFETLLTEIGEKENKAVFTKNDLRNLFADKSESWLSKAVAIAVKEGLLDRVKKGLFVHKKTSVLPFYVGTQLINAYRPNSINYISRESALSKWGVISQIPFCLTLMTTGRSGKILSDYGDYYFVHTARDVRKDIEAGKIIVYDYGERPPLAKPDVAVRDLKSVGLNVELVDWEAYEEAMEEAAAMPYRPSLEKIKKSYGWLWD